MKSMTGFGRGAASAENFALSVELKTVNNRFLDINLRIPAELQAHEADIKKLITKRLARGRVDVNFQYERTSDVRYEINRPLVSGFLAALNEMRAEFNLAGEPDLNVIARLPNVLQTRRDEDDAEFVAGVEKAFGAALDELEKMRETEGDALKTVLLNHLGEIELRLPKIENETANVVEEYRSKLTKRLNDILAKTESGVELDPARLAQEVAFLADRSDISEEIARLKAHIEQFRAITGETKDVGKRLDFLTQELNREANTIASKTNNLTVKENALAIKSEIEKIREQVQNIE